MIKEGWSYFKRHHVLHQLLLASAWATFLFSLHACGVLCALNRVVLIFALTMALVRLHLWLVPMRSSFAVSANRIPILLILRQLDGADTRTLCRATWNDVVIKEKWYHERACYWARRVEHKSFSCYSVWHQNPECVQLGTRVFSLRYDKHLPAECMDYFHTYQDNIVPKSLRNYFITANKRACVVCDKDCKWREGLEKCLLCRETIHLKCCTPVTVDIAQGDYKPICHLCMLQAPLPMECKECKRPVEWRMDHGMLHPGDDENILVCFHCNVCLCTHHNDAANHTTHRLLS